MSAETPDSSFRIIERTEKQRMFGFKKKMVCGGAEFGDVPLDYDPFPDAKPDDTVIEDPIGHEIIIKAECICTGGLSMGVKYRIDGHDFVLTELEEQWLDDGKMKCTFTASCFETFNEPLALLKVIRHRLKNSRPPK